MENLIYDVGAHLGEDSQHYLAKGFKVVAVEANPDLAQDILDAETAGKNRVTLVEWLEDLLTSTEE